MDVRAHRPKVLNAIGTVPYRKSTSFAALCR